MKKILLVLISALFTITAYSSTMLWNDDQLASVKRAVAKGDVRYAEAYKQLVASADKALRMKAPSVTDKEGVPPSGSKNDYTSLARYWWPNPNTKDGLPYVRHDGKTNPEIAKYDREVLGSFGKNTSILAMAYYLSGNEKYADKAVELIKVWFLDPKTKMNPNMTYAQYVPGVADGRAEGVLDTYSLVEAADAIEILAAAKQLNDADMKALRAWFADYAAWMQSSPTGKGERAAKNNHGLAYDIQLARFLAFAGDSKGAAAVVESFPAVRLDKQIAADGKQPLELARTLAFHYSVFNVTHILDMCDVARSLGIDLYGASNGKIDAAIGYLIPFIGNHDAFPYQQIKDFDAAERTLLQNIYRAAKYSPRAAEYMAIYNANTPKAEPAVFVLVNM